MAQTRRSLGLWWLLGCLLGSSACIENTPHQSDDTPTKTDTEPPTAAPVFDADFVSSPNPTGSDVAVSGGLAGSSAPANYVPASDTDAEHALGDADVLQLAGDRLYALSRFSGLTVVDASDPAALKSLGARRSAAIPVDMYVVDGVVYALFNDWESYACDAAGDCSWHYTARVQALDTRDPANIELIADVELPGNIDGSRRIGDVMVVVSDHVDGCWGCGDDYGTTVSSFSLAEPSPLQQLDQLALPSLGYVDRDNVAISDRRVYIAQTRLDESQGLLPSSIHPVDISDPSGALVAGVSFDVSGPIEHSWQLDELDGVLRVISQPRGWGSGQSPLLETFRINSSSDVQRAGSLSIPLHETYEVLDRVRFDTTRAYAGTSQKRHPVNVLDLSNPDAPRLAGQLDLPGRLYHLEPSGNRLLALGNSAGNGDGSLSLSLFDVEDPAASTLLGRVAFGDQWDRLPEDLSEDNDTVSVLREQGLVLVPFTGIKSDAASCEDAYGSGIQLLDMSDTTLTRRGVAPQVGSARRVLLQGDQLYGVGDGSVQAFDISDRDAPLPLSRLDVARDVSGVRVLGDDVLRLGSDQPSSQSTLDLTPLSRAGEPEPAARLDLSALLVEDPPACGGTWAWSGQVFVRGDYAYLPRYVQATDPQSRLREQQLTLYVVDIGDRSAPRAVGRLALPKATGAEAFTGVFQTENTLLVGRVRYEPGSYPSDPTAGAPGAGAPSAGASPDVPRYFYDIIELGNPAVPTIASQVEIPSAIGMNGWGWPGAPQISVDLGGGWYDGRGSALLTAGDLVISSHAMLVSDQPSAEAHYLDRLDVSDPYRPRWLDPINIPGAVLDFDAATNQLVTLDFVSEIEPGESFECDTRGYVGYFDSEQQACRVTRRSISAVSLQGGKAVRTSQVGIDRERRTRNIAVSDARIFITTSDFPSRARGGEPLDPPVGAVTTGTITLETLERVGAQLVQHPRLDVRPGKTETYDDRLYARGTRAFEILGKRLTVVGTLDAGVPTQLVHELPASTCSSLDVAGDTAYCATGRDGVEVIDLRATR